VISSFWPPSTSTTSSTPSYPFPSRALLVLSKPADTECRVLGIRFCRPKSSARTQPCHPRVQIPILPDTQHAMRSLNTSHHLFRTPDQYRARALVIWPLGPIMSFKSCSTQTTGYATCNALPQHLPPVALHPSPILSARARYRNGDIGLGLWAFNYSHRLHSISVYTLMSRNDRQVFYKSRAPFHSASVNTVLYLVFELDTLWPDNLKSRSVMVTLQFFRRNAACVLKLRLFTVTPLELKLNTQLKILHVRYLSTCDHVTPGTKTTLILRKL
jgi:hypothetical protein